MAQPKSKPTAVRMSADLQAAIAAHMAETGQNRNFAITSLIWIGLGAGRGAKHYVVKPGPAPGPKIERPKPGALLDKKGRHKWRL